MVFKSEDKDMCNSIVSEINELIEKYNKYLAVIENKPRKLFNEKRTEYIVNLYKLPKNDGERNCYCYGFYNSWREVWIALVCFKCGLLFNDTLKELNM